MSIIGKGSLSLRKQDVAQQKLAGTAYRRLVFAHKAAAGETGLDLTTLTQPSEMAALGFTNPSTADILSAKIFLYKKNVTVISSLRGVLMQDLSYTIPSSTSIDFQGFTSALDEIFTVTVETGVRDGLTLVDASPVVATGELAVGVTDFNTGTAFEVNKYSAQQIGAVLVFRNGQLQFRNPSNGTSGGNYQEVNNGSGLGTIIRFNNAPVTQSDNIVVWGSLLAERPDGSMMASIESIAGQVDAMIPTLASLAGVAESTFQAAPNNQDLKAFGDKILAIYPIIVGSAAQVTSGVASYSSVQSAINAAAAGQKILVLPGTYTENVSVGKEIVLEGSGRNSVINGTLTFTSTSDYSMSNKLKVTGNVTFDAGADGIFFSHMFLGSASTVTDNGSANYILYIKE